MGAQAEVRILEENPDLVSSLSEIVEERRVALDKLEDEAPARKTIDKVSAFNSIKRFFGLS